MDVLTGLTAFNGILVSKALYGLEIHTSIERPRPAILVSNHCMPLDPLFHGIAVFPQRNYFTLLEETVESPVLGTLVRLLGGIPLPRDSRRLAEIEAAVVHALKTRGFIHFYPEGECFLGNQNIFPFKAGAFYFAIRLQVPVVPLVTILKRVQKRGRNQLTDIQVSVHQLAPLYPPKASRTARANLTAARHFAQQVHDVMQAEIDRCGGDRSLYRGPMPRIRGVND